MIMGTLVYRIWQCASWCAKVHIPLAPFFLTLTIRILFGAVIPYRACIGKNVCIAYGGPGVVIHPRCTIGDNCYIGPGTVIGGTSGKYDVPKIGRNVFVGVGAKILGPISIGDNSVIGANAVVIDDIPSRCLAVGIPAKIIKHDIDILLYNDRAEIDT